MDWTNSFDDEGFLLDLKVWNQDIGRKMAEEQFGIQTTDFHMRIINFMREYYFKWGTLPMVKTIRDRFNISSEQLDEMFKRGQSTSRGVICKLAGLPKLLCIASGC